MIAYLSGTIQQITAQDLIVLNHGIGYLVRAPKRLLTQLHSGQDVALFTYQHIREDALDLYGFLEQGDLHLFQKLISVSGIGPKLGLAILSQFSAIDIQEAINKGDVALLKSISGVGKKTAERIVLDLKGNIDEYLKQTAGGKNSVQQEAVLALISLGYSQAEALNALTDIDNSLTTEEQIRQAFKNKLL
ncbi:MAG: Holliday junction DNA helicase RuvA [Candidatus Kerfeldbacteria bacterium RIFOXYA2_FULL_38_24]|uniref:Holliday junction branch migration complex subunit RuvA n=1 Tax=Candidatus Kerfeldbacteria bacterium RIFOXYB2_FULL_38_14 TaxID=1798547 RepID=A0A1G2BBJ6_9BACT|nr:MAG: Holliday junction DNA helicase RuvA [Candidatus Kerfeldbacteria bacterium RIFOXYA2_FULL_38_24]OGY86531.1 MAG: Holliday junction DNA helicase RuvA [Candidatus Kerfeldbacteria bacterium RIFOXYB2_FULL_38_14]OGY89266.1 MAG: Holliday junction DNA helicase RuvA [Candidatus Kerfeldbacteria bacterium RIFOXYC2_FULL_38_9]